MKKITFALVALFVLVGCAGQYTEAEVHATLTAYYEGDHGLPISSFPVQGGNLTETAGAQTGTPLSPTATPTLTPLPSETPIPTVAATREPTLAPTAALPTPVPPPASDDYVLDCGQTTGGLNFYVAGAPASVKLPPEQLARLATEEEMANRKDHENLNSLHLDTEFVIADAGSYLTFDTNDKSGSAWLVSPDTQYILSYPGEARANLPEGGFNWYTADAVRALAEQYEICAGSMQGQSWFVILSGKEWDHKRDTDFNTRVSLRDFNPGFIQVNRFPPGSFLSQKHLTDNVTSCHNQKTEGSDGATRCSVIILDVVTGAWVVIDHATPDAEWSQIATNIQH